MVNAKRGPFDRAELSPIEMVRAFHIIRANIIVKELSAFPRHDDLSAAHDRMFFDANDLQMAVIFVSHRWHSPSHPDPEGEQLSAVKIFLSWGEKVVRSHGFLGKPGRPFSIVLAKFGKYRARHPQGHIGSLFKLPISLEATVRSMERAPAAGAIC
jgi:hypothetical protein